MRKYAYLKEPLKCNKKDYVYKIMLFENKDGVYLFEYCSPDAVMRLFLFVSKDAMKANLCGDNLKHL